MTPAAITTWMLYSLCIGAVVTVAALAAAEAQRAANRRVRWVWAGAIVAILALTLVAPMRRSDHSANITLLTSAVVSSTTQDAPAVSAVGVWYAAARVALEMPLREALGAVQSVIDRTPMLVHRSLAVAWILGSLIVLGVFGVSYVRIRRRVSQWPVQHVADVDARIAPSAGPAVVGLAPPQIILPAWLLARSSEEQTLVVTHEMEHVRAGDPWLLIGACAALVLFPWNPALWFAFSRLQLAVELDCDRRVLKRGVPAAKYGALLIEISSLRVTLPSAMPAFSHNSSYLERRLLAMTSRVSRFAMTRWVAGVAVAGVALIAACESKLPTSAQIEKADGASATKQVAEAGLVRVGKVKFLVDGKPATAAEAEKISADKLASVRVFKATNPQDSSEVRLSTRAGSDSIGEWKVMVANGAMTDSMSRMRIKVRQEETSLAARSPGLPMKDSFNGLLYIDGRLSDMAELKVIPPQSIASVEVLKGSAAAKKYADPRALAGVIEVTLKQP
jgi:beta-lactamase regulating signal transducer with metallopeptidase domain